MPADVVGLWLNWLDDRHLEQMTPAEVARALRALSSCYVERRGKLVSGSPLDSGGKRAAFALFYAPMHFLTVREIVRALPRARDASNHLTDLGCGTGSAGAAWALEAGAQRIAGIDRSAWAVDEARGTYRVLGLRGRATRGDLARLHLRPSPGDAVLAAYSINELPDETRNALLPRLTNAHARGARILVIEPIARTTAPWWDEWARRFTAEGGRADEWRFPASLPERQRALAKAAGLDPRELTARTLWLG